jgi:D-serine deaminase-like pyridoxal phosphate-dependent protein
MTITVPTLLLNESVCRNNIRRMSEKARKNKVAFRPHFKTHQSAEIGEWFREEGVKKITVSSLRMAEYFANAGWKDILVAFPVNILEIDLINKLVSKIRLSLTVESPETIRFLAGNLKSAVEVYIKTDAGYHRTGVCWDDEKAISEIIGAISAAEQISLKGFLTHAGQSYKARSRKEIQAAHDESTSRMVMVRDRFGKDLPEVIASVGDTPSCSVIDDFSMIDEIRPGNFVFYDFTQIVIGSCMPDQVAVAMACPVVAVHPERHEIVIYGGSVHFAKDTVVTGEGKTVHGAVVQNTGVGWGDIVEGAFLTKMAQEHGIVQVPTDIISQFKPGDIIKIIPAHSCTTANLMKEYLTLDGEKISMFGLSYSR